MQLVGSVGLGGRNNPFDVGAVQRLLKGAGVSPGPIDQRCGILTIRAIEHFQHRFLYRPDGRVDVGGPTLRHLEAVARSHPTAAATPPLIPAPAAPLPASATPALGAPPEPPPPLRPSHPPAAPAHRATIPAAHPTNPPALVAPGRSEPNSYWQAMTPLVPGRTSTKGSNRRPTAW